MTKIIKFRRRPKQQSKEDAFLPERITRRFTCTATNDFFKAIGVEEGEQFICEEIFNFEDGDLICAVDKTEKVFIGRGFALGHSILISIEDSSRPIPRKEILFLGKPRKAR